MATHRETNAPEREARLRPEFAGQYPGLEPGVWLPAGGIVEFVLARARTSRRPSDPQQRELDAAHFDFRGGAGRPGPARTRATDR